MVQRILQSTAATLRTSLADQDGEPADAGVVTVRVQRADGTDVLAAGTATTSDSAGGYSVTLTRAQTASLDLLTATWTASEVVVATTSHEIAGGVYFTVAEARAKDASITTGEYPPAIVQAARSEVEHQCEEITGVAWVPRFAREYVQGSGSTTLVLSRPRVRRVRSISDVDSLGVLTAWDSDRVSIINANAGGVITSGYGFGRGRLVVEYEHGHDAPPPDLVTAAIIHLRHQLNTFRTTSLIDRATQVQTIEGQNLMLATPGRYGFETGIPPVDAVYQRYSWKIPGIA